jgi:tetratricopeptide (TPR) repeat protein
MKALSGKADPLVMRESATALVERALDLAARPGTRGPLYEWPASVKALADKVDRKTAPALFKQALALAAMSTRDAQAMRIILELAEALADSAEPSAARQANTELVQRALDLAPENGGFTSEKLTKTIKSSAAKVDRRSAVDLIKQALEVSNKIYDSRNLAEAIKVWAHMVDRESANALVKHALQLASVEKGEASLPLRMLAGPLETWAGKADPAAMRQAATDLIKLLLDRAARTNNSLFTLETLRQITWSLADKVDGEAATAFIKKALDLTAKTDTSEAAQALAETVRALAARVGRESANTLVRHALDLVAKAEGRRVLQGLVDSIKGLDDKVDPLVKRQVATVLVKRALELHETDVFNAFAEKIDPEAATALVQQTLAVARTGNTWSVRDLADTMKVWASRLDRKFAATLCKQALDFASRTVDPDTLRALADAIKVCASRLDRESATALCKQALDFASRTEDPNNLRALWESKESLQSPTEQVDGTVLLHLLVRMLTVEKLHRAGAVFRSILRRLSDKEAIDLLKHPCCVGWWQEVVLSALAERTRQPVRPLWETIRWLQEHRPELDLTASPTLSVWRPRGR